VYFGNGQTDKTLVPYRAGASGLPYKLYRSRFSRFTLNTINFVLTLLIHKLPRMAQVHVVNGATDKCHKGSSGTPPFRVH
jgi:hypothetical protein